MSPLTSIRARGEDPVTVTTLTTTDPYHETLKQRPVLFACVGVLHTLLTAGIVFGWASLLPILRLQGHLDHLSATDFSRIFTHGAIGNYMSSLPFGLVLDHFGPKTCGIAASLVFATGLVLCSMVDIDSSSSSSNSNGAIYLDIGFALLGFAGPALQLPTLHLARLFPANSAGTQKEGGGGGAAALYMSAQAGAFDGGTMVFAIFSCLAHSYFAMTVPTFFRSYLIVPAFTLLTAVFFWPNEILPDVSVAQTPTLQRRDSYIGAGSPYLSPATRTLKKQQQQQQGGRNGKSTSKLKDAPLSVVLSNPPFYCLAFWVSVHILKLNFVVATINDQLEHSTIGSTDTSPGTSVSSLSDSDLASHSETVRLLINLFGAILPFGFIVLPVVAILLTRSTMMAFQLANIIGVLYGLVLTFFPNQAIAQVVIVFTSVAVSRQLVYSTVFHQTGELFGFQNYGVLLGLANCVVSVVSLAAQGPLVAWAESMGSDYFWPNLVLVLATIPLFGVVYWTVPSNNNNNNNNNDSNNKQQLTGGLQSLRTPVVTETTLLLASPVMSAGRPRSYSDVVRLP